MMTIEDKESREQEQTFHMTGILTCEYVGRTELTRILDAVHKLAPAISVQARFTGATRTGEKIDTAEKYATLLDKKATARKVFFRVQWEDRELLVRPFDDRFTEVRIHF